jgi:predicted hydrocarbon binding protein
MHGVIFNEMRTYALARLGPRGWETLLAEAKLASRMYVAFNAYPDEEAVALVMAASRLTGNPPRAVLEDFGQFIAPSLAQTYKVFFKPGWSVMDVIEHVERIHDRVRNDPKATPPKLVCTREAPDRVRVSYSSARKLCGVGVGFIRGLAKMSGERVSIAETQCMHAGASSCELSVQLVGKAVAA